MLTPNNTNDYWNDALRDNDLKHDRDVHQGVVDPISTRVDTSMQWRGQEDLEADSWRKMSWKGNEERCKNASRTELKPLKQGLAQTQIVWM